MVRYVEGTLPRIPRTAVEVYKDIVDQLEPYCTRTSSNIKRLKFQISPFAFFHEWGTNLFAPYSRLWKYILFSFLVWHSCCSRDFQLLMNNFRLIQYYSSWFIWRIEAENGNYPRVHGRRICLVKTLNSVRQTHNKRSSCFQKRCGR